MLVPPLVHGLILAFVIGIVAGLRAMLAPAAVAWVASKGMLPLQGTWLAFLGYRFTPWIFTLLAAQATAAGASIARNPATMPMTKARISP